MGFPKPGGNRRFWQILVLALHCLQGTLWSTKYAIGQFLVEHFVHLGYCFGFLQGFGEQDGLHGFLMYSCASYIFKQENQLTQISCSYALTLKSCLVFARTPVVSSKKKKKTEQRKLKSAPPRFMSLHSKL